MEGDLSCWDGEMLLARVIKRGELIDFNVDRMKLSGVCRGIIALPPVMGVLPKLDIFPVIYILISVLSACLSLSIESFQY